MSKINYIILKANGNCNLSCNYCYYTHYQLAKWKIKYSLELLDLTFKKIAGYTDKITLCWHGGEPLLNGIDYYTKAIELQKKYSINIEHNLQTNGTLINDDWAKMFKENNFSIGISLDGNQSVNDKNRLINGKSSYMDVIRGMKILQRNEVKFGVLCYVNPLENGVNIFRHFVDLGVKKIDFLLPIVSHSSNTTIDEELLAQYFENIFNDWLTLNDPTIKIRIFEDVLTLLMGGKAKNCIFKNKCNGFITIEPNGDVGICENHRINGLENYLINKNILYDDFELIEKEVNTRSEIINSLPDNCIKCNILEVCKGGCSVERYNNEYKHTNIYCKTYKKLFINLAKKVYVQPQN
ncbi:MAG: radical SAM protein [Bacteroidota bacterium]